MCKGRPPNTEAIAILNTPEFQRLGHQDASNRLKEYGITLAPSSVGHMRNINRIPFLNENVATKFVKELVERGEHITYSELMGKFNITTNHAESLIKRFM